MSVRDVLARSGQRGLILFAVYPSTASCEDACELVSWPTVLNERNCCLYLNCRLYLAAKIKR